MLIALHELCGCFTMLNYTATIFRESGSSISPNFSAIIVGFIQLLGTYMATFLVDRLGRKILLVFSSIGTGLCLLCLGSYSYANALGFDVKPYSWISIASFSGMMFLAACGIIPLMFVVIAEVMPEKVFVFSLFFTHVIFHTDEIQYPKRFFLFSDSRHWMYHLLLHGMDIGICHGQILWIGRRNLWNARMGIFLCCLYIHRSHIYHCHYTRNQRKKLCRNCSNIG